MLDRIVKLDVTMTDGDVADLVRFMLWRGFKSTDEAVQSMIRGAKSHMAAKRITVDEAKVKRIMDKGRPKPPPPITDASSEINY